MSNKIVAGCGGCLVVVLIGTLLGYFFLVRPLMSGFDTFSEIHEINEKIENQETYEPTQNGELEEEQVERFVSVQQTLSRVLQEKFAGLEEKYKEKNQEWQDREPSIREVIAVWGDLQTLYADAKLRQVEVLNEEGFSLEEYRFVRQAFYHSLGYELFSYNLDLVAEAAGDKELMKDFEEFKADPRNFSEEANQKNRQLVDEYSDEAGEWLAFAWWGL